MTRFFRYGLILLCFASSIFIYSVQNQNTIAAGPGCTDPVAINYDPSATIDDGSCSYPPPPPPPVLGCMNPAATNYNPAATVDDGSCIIAPPPPPPVLGCMNPAATNYNPAATSDDGSCIVAPPPPPVISGCTNSGATNYNSGATLDDGSCIMPTPTPPPAGGGGGGGWSSAGPTTIITSTTIALTNSGEIVPNVKIVEKPCEITNYIGYISQVYIATNTGETIRERSPIDFTKMEGNCEGKNITPKVIKYPFNSFVARWDEWKTNRFPEDFYAYLNWNWWGTTVNQTIYIFTYSSKTIDITPKNGKNNKSTEITLTNNKEIVLWGDPIENLKPFSGITRKNPVRIYCTNAKEYTSRFPILDTYTKEYCNDVSSGVTDSNVKKEKIAPCKVTQFSGSLLRRYDWSAWTKIWMKFNVDYTDKKWNCTGDETPKIIRKLSCPIKKELVDYSSGVINYFNELWCGSKIHQDSYYFSDYNEYGVYQYIGSSDIIKEVEKTPLATLETKMIVLNCETAKDRLTEFPRLVKLYDLICKKKKTESVAPPILTIGTWDLSLSPQSQLDNSKISTLNSTSDNSLLDETRIKNTFNPSVLVTPGASSQTIKGWSDAGLGTVESHMVSETVISNSVSS